MSKLPKGYVVSYAQNKEDLIIGAFFPESEKRIYVDVGANHPVDDSVTKLFYDKGWSGINIEPNPSLYKSLVAKRKRDVNLNVGISDRVGSLTFRQYDNHGLSTFSDESKTERIEAEGDEIDYTEYDVRVIALRDVFEEYVATGETVAFLKIDVEGYEEKVLKGNDWDIYRPEMVCIEANHIHNDWRKILTSARYKKVFHDGINEYYLRDESLSRQQNFDYARDLLLSGVVINPGVARRIIQGEEDRYTALEQQKELEKLRSKIINLEKANNDLGAKLKNPKQLVRQLVSVLFSSRRQT